MFRSGSLDSDSSTPAPACSLESAQKGDHFRPRAVRAEAVAQDGR